MTENRNNISGLAGQIEEVIRQNRNAPAPQMEARFLEILARDVAEVAPGQQPNRFERHFEGQRLGSGELSDASIRSMNIGAARRTDSEWQDAFHAASQRIGTSLPEATRRLAAQAFEKASTTLTCDTLHEVAGGLRPNGPAPNLPEFGPDGKCR